MTITSLVDNRFGNLDDPDNPLVTNSTCLDAVGTELDADPPAAAPGESFTCFFDAQVTGDSGDPTTSTPSRRSPRTTRATPPPTTTTLWST